MMQFQFHFHFLSRWACAAALLLSTACTAPQHRQAQPQWHIVVVRHAEKDVSGDRDDRGLSAAGIARAQRIAQRLQTADVQAVYATGYRRTRDTAAPTAQAHGLTVTGYAANEPADAVATRLRKAQGSVLVVGHSNTVPAIVSALCQCAVAPIDEARFDDWYELRIDAAGAVRLQHARY